MLEAAEAAAILQKLTGLDAGADRRRHPGQGHRRGGVGAEAGQAGRVAGPGKWADLVRLRGDPPALANVHDSRRRSSTAPPPPTWPTSGSTASAGSPTAGWSTTTWPPLVEATRPWPQSCSPRQAWASSQGDQGALALSGEACSRFRRNRWNRRYARHPTDPQRRASPVASTRSRSVIAGQPHVAVGRCPPPANCRGCPAPAPN
jgi:hypothetical protein